MIAYTYKEHGKFEFTDKPKPEIIDSSDAIVRVTMSSICSSDLHIKHGSVPRAVPGITVGHEMVGIVEKIGADVKNFKVGDRVSGWMLGGLQEYAVTYEGSIFKVPDNISDVDAIGEPLACLVSAVSKVRCSFREKTALLL